MAAKPGTSLAAFLLAAVAACDQTTPPEAQQPVKSQPVPVETGVSLGLAEARARRVADLHYRVAFEVSAERGAPIPASVAAEFSLTQSDLPLQLDFREDPARIRRVTANGAAVQWLFENEHVVIPAAALEEGPNTIGIELLAGESALNRSADYLFTLFVPDRARTAIPLFDQPDLKASFELSLSIPRSWTAIGPGPVTRRTLREDALLLEFAPTKPISTYLFSFVAGDFETLTRERGGTAMTVLHRQPDPALVARNIDGIVDEHAQAIAWLEEYTGIDFPFAKLDIALLPSPPYGGMEHVGAIQYKADTLWLDAAASDVERLRRARLIAHEVAHMWFGNLVTMRWFNDVWTKEVFANFMADKLVNPQFPQIDHNLAFLLDHHPKAYAIDRSEGANPIRQPLPNLNEAGQLYGAIIYHKAPIMMRQLEALVGDTVFREAIREYLARFSYGNATWSDLVDILDAKVPDDLRAWSEVWVNQPGRPHFDLAGDGDAPTLLQGDPAARERLWPQRFAVAAPGGNGAINSARMTAVAATPLPRTLTGTDARNFIFNADGYGYGLFPARPDALALWPALDGTARGSLLIHLREQMLDGGSITPGVYLARLRELLPHTDDQLLAGLMLEHATEVLWRLLPPAQRASAAASWEAAVWEHIGAADDAVFRRQLFLHYAAVAQSPAALSRVEAIWSGRSPLTAVTLSAKDRMEIARSLAIALPEQAARIVAEQRTALQNPDQLRRWDFVAPSLSADAAVRDAFFASLADPAMREQEAWVAEALANLHHPLRVVTSEKYLQQSLELLTEIQVTGDIFFPSRWLAATLHNHGADTAVATVREFLSRRPDYNAQLRMKILQEADPMFRANRLLAGNGAAQ